MDSTPPTVQHTVTEYVYRKLRSKDDLRLVTILPGKPQDQILLEVSHSFLRAPDPPPLTKKMTLAELNKTLPPNWEAFETTIGRRVFFYYEDPETGAEESTWTHPISTVDSSLYLNTTEGTEKGIPSYEALSYTWGSPENPVTARIQDGSGSYTMPIGQNLASAIRHLREPKDKRTLWIDAISIDQSNIDERSEQVPRMVDIYRLAERVVVWLGPSDSTSAQAMKALAHLGTQTLTTTDDWTITSPEATEANWGSYTVLPFSAAVWTSLSQLLSRGWFERLWIIQEIQLARDAVVCCGTDAMSWFNFWNAIAFLWNNQHLPVEHISRLRIALIERLGRWRFDSPISGTILAMVDGRRCSDMRDLIYGLLGILPEGYRSRITPQYGLPVGRAYKEAMLAHIEHVQRLELFKACRLVEKIQPGVPSWVPDFSARGGISRQAGMQFASGVSRCWAACEWDEQQQQHILRVAGMRCATVKAVGKSVPKENDLWSSLATARDLEPGDLDTAPPYVTGEPFRVAYAKTLIGNYLKERFPLQQVPSLEAWLAQDSPHPFFGRRAPANKGLAALAWHEEQALFLLQGRPYFVTDEGYIGLGPPGTEVGDLVCVILGFDSPVVLRPHSSNPQVFALVGEAFVYGLHDAAVLLGPLPTPWRLQAFDDSSGDFNYRFFNPETNILSDDDPRLEPLEQWTRILDHQRTADDPTTFQCFKHDTTGEVIKHDPRLNPEALRKRGVDITTLCLA